MCQCPNEDTVSDYQYNYELTSTMASDFIQRDFLISPGSQKTHIFTHIVRYNLNQMFENKQLTPEFEFVSSPKYRIFTEPGKRFSLHLDT